MNYFLESRYHILLAIIVCYLVPLIGLILFSAFLNPITLFWLPTSIGLLFTGTGTLLLFILMKQWETTIQPKEALEPATAIFPPTPMPDPQLLADAEARYSHSLEKLAACTLKSDNLEMQLAEKVNEMLQLTKENEKIFRQMEQIRQEYDQFKNSTDEKLEQNDLFLGEYQQTINEQRQIVETRQQLVEQLETKVRDLTYEIKTLLQLAEKVQYDKPQTVIPIPLGTHSLNESDATYHTNDADRSPTHRLEVASLSGKTGQLKRCLDIAQKITGGSHYTHRQTRSRDLNLDNNALDLRRLCESLRSEATNALWVYSQKENKLLFANQEIKNLLGWHPEKFMQIFLDIVDANEWQRILSQLAYKNECESDLTLKTKGGQQAKLMCQSGVISTGLFRGHLICIVLS